MPMSWRHHLKIPLWEHPVKTYDESIFFVVFRWTDCTLFTSLPSACIFWVRALFLCAAMCVYCETHYSSCLVDKQISYIQILYERSMMACTQFLHYWPLMQGIHRSPSEFQSQKGQQWRVLMISLLLVWTSSWTNNPCSCQWFETFSWSL